MNESEVKGRIKRAKGKSREVVGKAVGNKQLQREGTVEKLSGEVEATYGGLKKEVGRVTK